MLPEAELWLDNKVDKLLILACQTVANKAKHFCPVDTGRLRGSITWATDKDEMQDLSEVQDSKDLIKKPNTKHTGRVGTAVDYALHIEYGTKNMGSSPFLRPALLTTDLDKLKRLCGFK